MAPRLSKRAACSGGLRLLSLASSSTPNCSRLAVLMAVNFCVESVGTLIESDNLCADGYEVENLISAAKRGRGFMAEYFIKPPVSVLVTLPCPAELSYIAVGLVRGSVRLTGFEIWVSNTAATPSTTRGDDDFVLIGKKFNATGDVIRFHNRCYAPRGPFALLNDGPSARSDVRLEETLKHFYCKHVCRVKLRLIRTSGSSSVGLGSLEIWGQPMAALSNPDAQNELIRKSRAAISTGPGFTEAPTSYFASHAEATTSVGERSPPLVPSSTQTQRASMGSDPPELTIPADFQDALTFELMTQPVLLPSGQVVDQSTLDKHVEMEQRWGRVATDPFTGTPLAGGASRPKSLPELKSRIDHFVVRNLDKLGDIPRVLGAAPQLETAGNTRVSALTLLPSQPKASLVEVAQKGGTCSASRASEYCHKPGHSTDSQEPSKRSSNFVAVCGKEVSMLKTSISATALHRGMSSPRDSSSANSGAFKMCEKRKFASDSAESKRSRPDPGTHEARLADSLSSSLSETLQRVRRVAASKADDGGALCFACNAAQPTHRVPCSHNVCQPCLMDSVRRGQCSCGRAFQTSQVVRVHTVC